MPRPSLLPDRRKLLLLAVIGGAAVGVGAASATPLTYSLDPAASRVHWEVVHFGTSTIRGRFDDTEGSITLDRQARSGQVSVRIATASVSSGMAGRCCWQPPTSRTPTSSPGSSPSTATGRRR
jgi:polyisoprenoid-binding protein YceI